MYARRNLLAALGGLIAAALSPPCVIAAEEKKKGGGLTFLQFPTLTATCLRQDGHRGVMTVEVGVDILNSGLQARAQLVQPRLRAAYVQVLQTYAAGLGPGAAPNADYIARVLQAETDRVLGRSGARLLLGTILVN